MRHRGYIFSLHVLALALLGATVSAQPAIHTVHPLYDPQQFPSLGGEVQRFTLTGRGDIDGFIMQDGTEVKTAPNLSTQMASFLRPGDHVTVRGLRAAALPLVSAVSVADVETRRTVTDMDAPATPPAPPPAPLGARDRRSVPAAPPSVAVGQTRETSGLVRMLLHTAQGEINGALLDNGTILRFPPDRAGWVATLLQPRQSLVAEGIGTSTPFGTVIEVRLLGSSRETMNAS